MFIMIFGHFYHSTWIVFRLVRTGKYTLMPTDCQILALSPNKETSFLLYSSIEPKAYKPSSLSFSLAVGPVVLPSSTMVNGPRTKCTSFGSCSSKFRLFRLLVQALHCEVQVEALLLIKHANALQWK